MPIYKVTGYVMTPEVAMTRYIEADDPKEAVAEYCDKDWKAMSPPTKCPPMTKARGTRCWNASLRGRIVMPH
jgi:uncharacterized OB-fold protein